LTKAQFDTFCRIAVGDDTRVSSRVAKALIGKGLINRYEEIVSETPIPTVIIRYEVPIPIHIEWAQWCSANVDDE